MPRKKTPSKPHDPRRWLEADEIAGFKNEVSGFTQSPIHRVDVSVPSHLGNHFRTALYAQVVGNDGRKDAQRYILVFGWEQKEANDPPDRLAVVMVEPRHRRVVRQVLQQGYVQKEHVCFWEWGLASAS